jgi:hypothetical protein
MSLHILTKVEIQQIIPAVHLYFQRGKPSANIFLYKHWNIDVYGGRESTYIFNLQVDQAVLLFWELPAVTYATGIIASLCTSSEISDY